MIDVKKYMRKTFNTKFQILSVENVTKKVSMGITFYNVSMKVKWRDNSYVRKHFHYIFDSSYAMQFGTEFIVVEPIDVSFIREMRLKSLLD